MDLESRARIAKNLPQIIEWQRKVWEDKAKGQNDLFAVCGEPPPLELEEAEPWTLMYALEQERKASGLYLSGHPLDWMTPAFERKAQLEEERERNEPEKAQALHRTVRKSYRNR